MRLNDLWVERRSICRRFYLRLRGYPRTLRSVPPLLALLVATWSGWQLSRSPDRTFTLIVKEVAFQGDLPSFGNSQRIRRVATTLAAPATVSPCPYPAATGTAHNSCLLEGAGAGTGMELIAATAPAEFSDLRLRNAAGNARECPSVLRFDRSEEGASLLSWFPAEASCSPEVSFGVNQHHTLVLKLDGKPVADLAPKQSPLEGQLPVSGSRPVELDIATSKAEGARTELWKGNPPVQLRSFVPAALTSFELRVGGVLERRCDASPAHRVQLSSGSDEAIALALLSAAPEGLELSFNAKDEWILDTGTCKLSTKEAERTAFGLLSVGQLAALLGLLSWIRDWFWR